MKFRASVLFLLVCTICTACRADVAVTAPVFLPPDAVVATFDKDADLPETRLISARATRDADAFAGGGSLKIVFHATDPIVPPELRLPLTAGIDSTKCGAIAFQARASPAGDQKEIRIRIGLCDGAGRQILQRLIAVPMDEKWNSVDISLDRFRWGKIAGGWNEARSIQVAIESPFSSIWLDEVKLMPRRADEGTPGDRLRKLAFADRDARLAEADGLFVATDAADLTEADVVRLLGNMRRSRALIRRLFGDAVRPIDSPMPAALLIFKDQPSSAVFWQTMGRQWGARIVPPQSGGYTVQDIATSSYDAKLGNDRPVWLHESVHAVVGHDLRLAPGTAAHSWFQEGLANYIQLCIYPGSLDSGTYPRLFAAGVQDRPQAFFRPLKSVLTERVTSQQYAQLASLIAYLVEAKPEWLPKIAAALADGTSVDKVLAGLGTDFDGLEKDWLAWGRKRFAEPRKDGHFGRPAEWNAR